MKTEELIAAAERLVKELQGRIDGGRMGLDEAEGKILEMVNWIGEEMAQEVVAGLTEPTTANQITVSGEVAVFERVRNLRFINRFGEEVVRARRCYRYRDRAGGVAPLDMRLGIDGCFGFSPLMTFLICMLGADESYGRAAEKLAATLGFKVSSTAVQRTTEKTGERIPEDPDEVIDEQYAEQAGLRMGFLQAPESVFLADGGRHNWDIQETHFPAAVPILDYYHAAEHLADYCDLLPATYAPVATGAGGR